MKPSQKRKTEIRTRTHPGRNCILSLFVLSFCFAAGCSQAPASAEAAADRTQSAPVYAPEQKEKKPVIFLQADGTEIPQDLFLLFLREQKAAAVNRFAGQEESLAADFWTTPTKEGIPLEWAKDRATDEAVRFVQLIRLAVQEGILLTDDLQVLEEQRLEENENRQQSAEDEQPVYGNTSFSRQSWVDYVRKGLQQELVRAYENRTEASSQDLLRLYAEESSQFAAPASFQLTVFHAGGQSEDVTLVPAELGKEETEKQDLAARLEQCAPGDVLEDVLWQSEPVTVVFAGIQEGDPLPFEEVQDQLQQLYARRKLDDDLEERCARAAIERNEEAFAEVQMP